MRITTLASTLLSAAIWASSASAAEARPNAHWFQFESRILGHDDAKVRRSNHFYLFKGQAELRSQQIALADDTFVNGTIRCADRDSELAPHHCQIDLAGGGTQKSLTASFDVGPGKRVVLGTLLKVDGTRVELAVNASGSDGDDYPIATPPPANPLLLILDGGEGGARSVQYHELYQVDRIAHLRGIQLKNGLPLDVGIACEDVPQPKHKCTVDVTGDALVAPLHAVAQTTAASRALIGEVHRTNGPPIHISISFLTPTLFAKHQALKTGG